jgi:long-chain-fatty-acid--CoA ligase ACSBG
MDRLYKNPLVAFTVSTAVFVAVGCHRVDVPLIKNESSSRQKKKTPPATIFDNSNRRLLKGLPTDVMEPLVEAEGEGALPPKTVIAMFRESVERNGDKVALGLKRKGADGVLPAEWKYWTYSGYWRDCVAFAKSLLSLKVEKFAVVNILGFNSPEWLIANNGSIMAGCIAAGIYITNSSPACRYISNHSKANVLFCDGPEQLRKYTEFVSSAEQKAEHLPDLRAIVMWGGAAVDAEFAAMSVVPVYSWEEFMLLGAAANVSSAVLEARMAESRPGECAALIYTSGTTGPPKAVMLSHDNITWMCRNFATNYVKNGTAPGGRVVSYLPLSHVAAQMIDIHYVYFAAGCTYFAQPDALKGSLSQTLVDVRPTVFFGVPRVWEKMEEKLKEIGRQSTGLKKRIADWAKALGSQHQQGAQYGAGDSRPWGYNLAYHVVLKKVREALGLDKCNAFFTAAAPISVETLQYFGSLDIPVHELFGASESTGPHTSSKYGAWRMGYCGRSLPGVHTLLDGNGGRGELLL